ncbi:hypothetical protein BGX21_006472 [Mortierella sp. AD011]|nr:hypothetical protein BGX20_006818 [Mortierella sp. AD010]KAF9399314.1 hypothetical protein BGX21_006472 [Mortierella sp. AD011]
MSPTPSTHGKVTPAVLIVGGGIGGLMLATLFERINISYHIFERAKELRSLGSAMTMAANILPVFEQLGLLSEIESIALPCPALNFYDGDVNKIGSITLMGAKDTGYENLLFARPKLYELLRKQVPESKISLNKKVLRSEEVDGRVVIHCSDNTTYEGDILIGADGAYSGVRQSLYKHMEEKGILPKSDSEDLSIGYVAMVGVSNPPNPEKYPQLKDNYCHFSQVLGPNSRNWTAVSVPNNQVCWGFGVQLTEAQAKDQQFRNSEWGPEANDAMIKEFQDLPCPWGGTMAELIENTPKDLISKVFLEEKIFKTWFHGRTVLIGDACHKMLPGAGLGAVNAMHDAVILTNCIYEMKDVSAESIKAAFQSYYDQRFAYSNEQFKSSSAMSRTMFGQTPSARFLRNIILNYLPAWLQRKDFAKTLSYRPQISWLPLAENRGTIRVQPQGIKK